MVNGLTISCDNQFLLLTHLLMKNLKKNFHEVDVLSFKHFLANKQGFKVNLENTF